MTRILGMFLNPLIWKGLVIALGISFAVANLLTNPSDLIEVPDEMRSYQTSGIKAAGFAIITAIALFAGSIPTGEGRFDRIVDAASRMLGICATLGAGWFWLHSETQGVPGRYIYGIIILTVAAAVTVLVWAGIYALLAIAAHGASTVLRDSISSMSRAARSALHLQRRR